MPTQWQDVKSYTSIGITIKAINAVTGIIAIEWSMSDTPPTTDTQYNCSDTRAVNLQADAHVTMYVDVRARWMRVSSPDIGDQDTDYKLAIVYQNAPTEIKMIDDFQNVISIHKAAGSSTGSMYTILTDLCSNTLHTTESGGTHSIYSALTSSGGAILNVSLGALTVTGVDANNVPIGSTYVHKTDISNNALFVHQTNATGISQAGTDGVRGLSDVATSAMYYSLGDSSGVRIGSTQRDISNALYVTLNTLGSPVTDTNPLRVRIVADRTPGSVPFSAIMTEELKALGDNDEAETSYMLSTISFVNESASTAWIKVYDLYKSLYGLYVVAPNAEAKNNLIDEFLVLNIAVPAMQTRQHRFEPPLIIKHGLYARSTHDPNYVDIISDHLEDNMVFVDGTRNVNVSEVYPMHMPTDDAVWTHTPINSYLSVYGAQGQVGISNDMYVVPQDKTSLRGGFTSWYFTCSLGYDLSTTLTALTTPSTYAAGTILSRVRSGIADMPPDLISELVLLNFRSENFLDVTGPYLLGSREVEFTPTTTQYAEVVPFKTMINTIQQMRSATETPVTVKQCLAQLDNDQSVVFKVESTTINDVSYSLLYSASTFFMDFSCDVGGKSLTTYRVSDVFGVGVAVGPVRGITYVYVDDPDYTIKPTAKTVLFNNLASPATAGHHYIHISAGAISNYELNLNDSSYGFITMANRGKFFAGRNEDNKSQMIFRTFDAYDVSVTMIYAGTSVSFRIFTEMNNTFNMNPLGKKGSLPNDYGYVTTAPIDVIGIKDIAVTSHFDTILPAPINDASTSFIFALQDNSLYVFDTSYGTKSSHNIINAYDSPKKIDVYKYATNIIYAPIIDSKRFNIIPYATNTLDVLLNTDTYFNSEISTYDLSLTDIVVDYSGVSYVTTDAYANMGFIKLFTTEGINAGPIVGTGEIVSYDHHLLYDFSLANTSFKCIEMNNAKNMFVAGGVSGDTGVYIASNSKAYDSAPTYKLFNGQRYADLSYGVKAIYVSGSGIADLSFTIVAGGVTPDNSGWLFYGKNYNTPSYENGSGIGTYTINSTISGGFTDIKRVNDAIYALGDNKLAVYEMDAAINGGTLVLRKYVTPQSIGKYSTFDTLQFTPYTDSSFCALYTVDNSLYAGLNIQSDGIVAKLDYSGIIDRTPRVQDFSYTCIFNKGDYSMGQVSVYGNASAEFLQRPRTAPSSWEKVSAKYKAPSDVTYSDIFTNDPIFPTLGPGLESILYGARADASLIVPAIPLPRII